MLDSRIALVNLILKAAVLIAFHLSPELQNVNFYNLSNQILLLENEENRNNFYAQKVFSSTVPLI